MFASQDQVSFVDRLVVRIDQFAYTQREVIEHITSKRLISGVATPKFDLEWNSLLNEFVMDFVFLEPANSISDQIEPDLLKQVYQQMIQRSKAKYFKVPSFFLPNKNVIKRALTINSFIANRTNNRTRKETTEILKRRFKNTQVQFFKNANIYQTIKQ